MSQGIIKQLEAAASHPKTISRRDWEMSSAAAGNKERIATTQVKRPHSFRSDIPVSVAVMAYEEFATDGTAGNQETFNLSNDYIDSEATDVDILAYEDGASLAVDSSDYANDTVTVTAANASATVGVFYTAGDQATVSIRKRDPKNNDETIFSGDIGLLHQRDHGKEPVTLDFDSLLQAVVPTNWHIDVYADAPYQVALAVDMDGDGDDEEATNALLGVPMRHTTDRINGLSQAVKDDRSAR